MGDLYRVIVFRETPDESSDMISVTLVELAAPREMLAQFAPQAVAAALGTTAQDAALVTRVDPPETAEQAVQRRKRRTKAEMEAARNGETTVQTSGVGGGPVTQIPVPAYPEHPRTAKVAEVDEKKVAYNPFGNG